VPADLPLPDPPIADGAAALRPWSPDDLPDLLAGAADPLVHRFRYSLPDNAEQARAWLAVVADDRRSGDRLELAVTAAGDPTASGRSRCGGFTAATAPRADVLVYGLVAGELSSD